MFNQNKVFLKLHYSVVYDLSLPTFSPIIMEILRSYQNLPLYIQTIFNLLLEIIRYRNYWSQISDRKNVDKHKNCKKKTLQVKCKGNYCLSH